jgi:hypothetical protein
VENRLIDSMSVILAWDNKSFKGEIIGAFNNNVLVTDGVTMKLEGETTMTAVSDETWGVPQPLSEKLL